MKTRQRQSGMSIPGMLAIAVMVGFFIMCIVRMTGPYLEYLSVKSIIEEVVTEHDPETNSIGDIRRRISALFNTNQIYELRPKEVEVFRKDGKTYVDARYEVRLPIMGPIDAVLRFDDLLYMAGDPTPLTGLAASKAKQ